MKIRITNRYGVVPNKLLNNPEIGLKAKGLYAYIQSKPDDWEFSSERIALDNLDGRDSVRSALRELEEKGYLIRIQNRTDSGKFEMDYLLCEEANIETAGTENPSRTGTENPTPDCPTPENPSSNKERNTKKEIQKKIYTHWNSKKIIEHTRMTESMAHVIDSRLKEYTEEEITKAIDNYSNIFHSPKTYFSHKWTLEEFLKRSNGMPVFLYKSVKDYEKDTPTDPAHDREEAKRKEEMARKREKDEEMERKRREDEARKYKDKMLRFFRSLSVEKQTEIESEAVKTMDQFSISIKDKYPGQYEAMKESKIASIVAREYP